MDTIIPAKPERPSVETRPARTLEVGMWHANGAMYIETIETVNYYGVPNAKRIMWRLVADRSTSTWLLGPDEACPVLGED